MSELFERCDDIYTTVMITAKRAKQIIDKSAIQIDENEDVDDSIEFSENEIIVDVDSNRIKQVVLNLVSNAIKYNKPNGKVVVSYLKQFF